MPNLGAPLHVVAHDFGAWVAHSWALLFESDFKSLTLIDAGIPGVTLTEEIQLSDYKRKWNFIFQMLPDLPAELTKGKEDAAPPRDPNLLNNFLNLRVTDIRRCHEVWSSRGAKFITEPKVHATEIRCYMRDPDGYLIEVGQTTMTARPLDMYA